MRRTYFKRRKQIALVMYCAWGAFRRPLAIHCALPLPDIVSCYDLRLPVTYRASGQIRPHRERRMAK